MKRFPITGRSTTMCHSRTLRIVILAAGILAFSASAAQARPLGLGYTDPAPSQSSNTSYHHLYPAYMAEYLTGQSSSQSEWTTFRLAQSQHRGTGLTPSQLRVAQGMNSLRPPQSRNQIMSPAVDSPNSQQLQVYRGFTRVQAVPASNSGFNWTAILLGAGIFAALMLLAGAATSHVKPGRVAQA
jgi:hypothetical protein